MRAMRGSSILLLLALGSAVALLAPRPEQHIDAGTAVRLEVEDLVDRSDLVFEGRVVDRRVMQDARGRIETSYTLQIERTFWGDDEAVRTVRLPGGVLADGRGLILPGMPAMSEGEDVLLFLSQPGSTGIRVPVGLAQGKLRVVTDLSGDRFLVGRQGGMTLADPDHGTVYHAGSGAVLGYAETVARVHAAADARKARIAAGEEE